MKKCNRTNIGGQAVLEGVMMRGQNSMATAVRDEDGVIRLETERLKPLKEKPFICRVPIIRGIINFFSSLILGSKILMRSAEVYGEEEPTKFEKWMAKTFKVNVMDMAIWLGAILGIGLAIVIFIMLPQFIANLFVPLGIEQTSIWFNLIEGGVKILIFIVYILLTTLLKDIRRTYMYHGAEHKTISCFECGLDLTVENVKKCSRVHDRCGTTFMFFVMFVSIIVFSLFNGLVHFEGVLRILLKIALLPLVAGLSYELLKGLAKTDCPIFLPIKAPGLLLQHLTTREPDDSMIEVAITAFKTVLEMDKDLTIPTQKFVTAEKVDKLLKDVKEKFAQNNIDEVDGEWIVSIVSGIERSNLANNDSQISPKKVLQINEYVEKRLTGEPLWYIIGDTEFYGYKIKVNKNVLIPRPETEELVYNALSFINKDSKVLDLCTGSGCIAIAVKKEKDCFVKGADISKEALSVAIDNATLNNAQIDFVESDLFENITDKFDIIISNPPYIVDGEALQKEVTFEPKIALYGGIDGLDYYRRIAKGCVNYLTDKGIIMLEFGIGEGEKIKELFSDNFDVEIIKDINGIDRIIKGVKR